MSHVPDHQTVPQAEGWSALHALIRSERAPRIRLVAEAQFVTDGIRCVCAAGQSPPPPEHPSQRVAKSLKSFSIDVVHILARTLACATLTNPSSVSRRVNHDTGITFEHSLRTQNQCWPRPGAPPWIHHRQSRQEKSETHQTRNKQTTSHRGTRAPTGSTSH